MVIFRRNHPRERKSYPQFLFLVKVQLSLEINEICMRLPVIIFKGRDKDWGPDYYTLFVEVEAAQNSDFSKFLT